MGPVESAVRDDVKDLGQLLGVEPTLAELAYRVAREIDQGGGEEGRQMSALSRELRLTLQQLTQGHGGGIDDEFGDLAAPE
ncbi:hypothetical protein C4B68_26140 [Streptomyces dengpaensis]|uniref:Uncharacterized protein n=1 Tax=Streptomyces dengpaensis TaxID=2049881 RepID=A0ABN5I6E0_9ACTN|nr:hypothetical protein C4B68_26140 [Streptomyces dengpaensis]PIB11270.1 hypothetical protein B1C81_05500 [Streptomyces sp. HG99]